MKYEPDSAKGEAQRIWYNMLNTVNSNRNDCFNLEFGNWFKKINAHHLHTSTGTSMYTMGKEKEI